MASGLCSPGLGGLAAVFIRSCDAHLMMKHQQAISLHECLTIYNWLIAASTYCTGIAQQQADAQLHLNALASRSASVPHALVVQGFRCWVKQPMAGNSGTSSAASTPIVFIHGVGLGVVRHSLA